MTKTKVKVESGQHLAIVRSFIKNNARNGNDVTWFSDDGVYLNPVTVNEMEEMAQRIRNAAISEFICKLRRELIEIEDEYKQY